MATLFNGVYSSPTTPLWLSALNPTPGPNNLQVSTLTVNPTGGIIMVSDNDPYPASSGAPVSFNRVTGQPPTALQQAPSKQVPTKAVEGTYLASVTNGGTVYDDIALQGLQIYGPQTVLPSANTGCAGYLTQGPTPNSIQLYTGEFYTDIFNARVGNFSTINVSTGTLQIPDPLNVSTLNASTINTGNLNTSSIVAGSGSFSTINISTFVLPTNFGFDTITGSTINVSTISSGTITSGTISSGIGTFSTLIAPGFSGGGGAVATSTVTASTITTGLLSTVVATVKEVFVSTMTFNATLSPNIDLGLGGIIGGLAGGFGANALSVGLGAAALGTGITALVLARQSGGPEPLVFQTVNGTSQLQFSTLGTATPSRFTTNNAFGQDPRTTPGVEQVTNTTIQPGTYCMRTVSDHLNLPNASGSNNLGINAFSQWTPVFNGNAQVVGSRLSTINVAFGGYLDLIDQTPGNVGVSLTVSDQQPKLIIKRSTPASPFIIDATYGSMYVNGLLATTLEAPIFSASTIIGTAANINPQPITVIPGIVTSTIAVSTLTIGNARFNGFIASTITASTITAGPSFITTANIPVAQISSLTSQQLINVSSINNVVYPPPVANPTPVGAVIAFAGANAPTGYLICDGVNYSQVTYAALFAVIGVNYGAVGAGNFAVPDLRSRTVFGSSAPTFLSQFAPFTMVATTFSSVITEFPGSVAPNGIVARQALAVQSVQVGYELAVGMRVNVNTGTDQTVRVIIDILNYPGNFGQGGPFIYPNFPIIILNTPFTIDLPYLGPTFTVTPVAPYKYTLGLQTSGNFNTQTPYQVAGHTHTQLQGGGGASQLSGGIKAGDLNTSGPQTGGVTQNYYYTIGPAIVGQQPVVYNIPTSMATVPSAIAMNWIIKT